MRFSENLLSVWTSLIGIIYNPLWTCIWAIISRKSCRIHCRMHLTCHRLTNPIYSKYFSISRLQLFWKLHITLLCTCAWYLYEQMYFTLNHYMLVGQEYSQFDTLLSETRRYNYSYLLCLCNYWFRNALLQV